MTLFEQKVFVRDLKESRFWSLDWVSTNGIEGPFEYVVLRKREGGGYDHHGTFPTAAEAFNARRELVAETGQTNYFLRCRRMTGGVEVVGPTHPDAGEPLDKFRDVYRTGDTSLLTPEEVPAFTAWAARTQNDVPF